MGKEPLERISYALQKALNMGAFNVLESKQIHSDLNEILNIINELNAGAAKKGLGDSV